MTSAEDNLEADITSCCASCGIAENDDVKLNKCTDCDLVRYCSVECQRDDITQHLPACKKRAAELRDELIFKQPESSHLGDCPICLIPLPIVAEKSTMMPCCCKVLCNGCSHANDMRLIESSAEKICPFCRNSLTMTGEERAELEKNRLKANDPVALCNEAVKQYKRGDYRRAFAHLTKAAELGDVDAHLKLGSLYRDGLGVEKDTRKALYHLEEAAISGHPTARHNLGVYEMNYGTIERALKHWIIAARQGQDDSIKVLMNGFKNGLVEKDDLSAALRAHQAAVDATKSPQREAAKNIR